MSAPCSPTASDCAGCGCKTRFQEVSGSCLSADFFLRELGCLLVLVSEERVLLGPCRWDPALRSLYSLLADRPNQHRPEPGAQPRSEERECTAAARTPEQGAQGQAAGDGECCQVQVQGLHCCLGGQDCTAGGTAGQRDQVGAPPRLRAQWCSYCQCRLGQERALSSRPHKPSLFALRRIRVWMETHIPHLELGTLWAVLVRDPI